MKVSWVAQGPEKGLPWTLLSYNITTIRVWAGPDIISGCIFTFAIVLCTKKNKKTDKHHNELPDTANPGRGIIPGRCPVIHGRAILSPPPARTLPSAGGTRSWQSVCAKLSAKYGAAGGSFCARKGALSHFCRLGPGAAPGLTPWRCGHPFLGCAAWLRSPPWPWWCRFRPPVAVCLSSAHRLPSSALEVCSFWRERRCDKLCSVKRTSRFTRGNQGNAGGGMAWRAYRF